MIDHFKTIQNFKDTLGTNNFLVVGSLALKVIGVNLEVGDIDIVINSKDTSFINKLRILEVATKVKIEGIQDYGPKESRIDFTFQEVKFNAFLNDEDIFNRQHVWKDYIRYATLMDILKYKKKYNRPKDWKFIGKLICDILTPIV